MDISTDTKTEKRAIQAQKYRLDSKTHFDTDPVCSEYCWPLTALQIKHNNLLTGGTVQEESVKSFSFIGGLYSTDCLLCDPLPALSRCTVKANWTDCPANQEGKKLKKIQQVQFPLT